MSTASRCRLTAPHLPARPICPSSSCCRKSLGSTSTSLTPRAAWPAPAIWRSPLSCMCARVTRRAIRRSGQADGGSRFPRCRMSRSWPTWTPPSSGRCAHGGNAGKVGITGFCWGGRHHLAVCKALIPQCQGGCRLVRSPGGARPPRSRRAHPVDIAARLGGPVLGLYGGAGHRDPP
jgi:hypothetical protein